MHWRWARSLAQGKHRYPSHKKGHLPEALAPIGSPLHRGQYCPDRQLLTLLSKTRDCSCGPPLLMLGLNHVRLGRSTIRSRGGNEPSRCELPANPPVPVSDSLVRISSLCLSALGSSVAPQGQRATPRSPSPPPHPHPPTPHPTPTHTHRLPASGLQTHPRS